MGAVGAESQRSIPAARSQRVPAITIPRISLTMRTTGSMQSAGKRNVVAIHGTS